MTADKKKAIGLMRSGSLISSKMQTTMRYTASVTWRTGSPVSSISAFARKTRLPQLKPMPMPMVQMTEKTTSGFFILPVKRLGTSAVSRAYGGR